MRLVCQSFYFVGKGGSGYFLLIKALMEMVGLDSLADFVRMAEQAGTLVTEYMKQGNSTL
ncbi:hypothetical protein [Blautia marasmi]|uniref:hypothetical protein n=1 Tax=Blautia marasmi TaxID=1917868 RepID=UPI000CF2230F|nr:hypothetical protein [Blautia marasmi]